MDLAFLKKIEGDLHEVITKKETIHHECYLSDINNIFEYKFEYLVDKGNTKIIFNIKSENHIDESQIKSLENELTIALTKVLNEDKKLDSILNMHFQIWFIIYNKLYSFSTYTLPPI